MAKNHQQSVLMQQTQQKHLYLSFSSFEYSKHLSSVGLGAKHYGVLFVK